MRRFLSYYRQFDELSPGRGLARAARAPRRGAPAPSRPAAAARPVRRGAGISRRTRRSSTPRRSRCGARSTSTRTSAPLRAAIAASHDIDPARVVVGHGAGELLRAALHALAERRGRGRLARLGAAAGARDRGGRDARAGRARGARRAPHDRPDAARRPDRDRRAARRLARAGRRALADPRRGARRLPARRRGRDRRPPARASTCARSPRPTRWPGSGSATRCCREGVELPLAPVLGVGAPALAGALWAVENGAESARRRRAQAAAERARLEAALADTPFHPSPGHGPYVWLAAPAAGARRGARRAADLRRARDGVGRRAPRARDAARRGGDRPSGRGAARQLDDVPGDHAPPRPRSPARPARRSRRARAAASAALTAGGGCEQSCAHRATTIRPPSSASRGAPVEPVRVDRPHADLGVQRRDRERVGQQPARAVGAALEPLQHQRLDRDPRPRPARARGAGTARGRRAGSCGCAARSRSRRDAGPTSRATARAAPAASAAGRRPPRRTRTSAAPARAARPRSPARPSPAWIGRLIQGAAPTPRSPPRSPGRPSSRRRGRRAPTYVIVGQTTTAYSLATAPSWS